MGSASAEAAPGGLQHHHSKQHQQRDSTTVDIKSAPETRSNILINASTKATDTRVLQIPRHRASTVSTPRQSIATPRTPSPDDFTTANRIKTSVSSTSIYKSYSYHYMPRYSSSSRPGTKHRNLMKKDLVLHPGDSEKTRARPRSTEVTAVVKR
jgi:hypothetical protein